MSNNRIKVLYIGGSGRCGSTLLSTLLGNQEGFVDCGELRYIWDRGLIENRQCGCSDNFRDCEYWKSIISTAYGDKYDAIAKHMSEVTFNATRYRNHAKLTDGGAADYLGVDSEYISNLEKLYTAIHYKNNRNIIIDSSKHPSYSYLLSLVPNMDVYFIKLIRDPRAVVYSWGRKKTYEPGSNKEMDRFGVIKSTLMWKMANGLSDKVLKIFDGEHLRYEDLVGDVDGEISALIERIGLWANKDIDCIPLSNIEWRCDAHNVAGNPMRFHGGNVNIKKDLEWEERLGNVRKFLISILCHHDMMKYKYI